jgi:hypothetical protein
VLKKGATFKYGFELLPPDVYNKQVNVGIQTIDNIFKACSSIKAWQTGGFTFVHAINLIRVSVSFCNLDLPLQ